MSVPLDPSGSSSRKLNRRAFIAGAATAAVAGWAAAGSGSATAAPAEMISARQKFFGSSNVDPHTGAVAPSKVILSWFGVTGYAMAIGGTVVLLDAWIPRGTYAPVVDTSVRELAALQPSHIFIGHGHFDHAADAPEIAAASGATVVGTDDHVAAINAASPVPLRRRAVADGAELRLDGDVTVRVVEHRHSQLRAPYGEPDPLILPPDLNRTLQHRPSPEDFVHLCSHLGDPEGGNLLYQFQIGDFVLTWHDTTGPLRSDAPGVLTALRALRASSVQVGSIQGYNQYTNGLRDPLDYIEALRPRIFVPSHHDNWLAPISAPAVEYGPPLRAALAGLPKPPELRLLADPADYLRPDALTFEI